MPGSSFLPSVIRYVYWRLETDNNCVSVVVQSNAAKPVWVPQQNQEKDNVSNLSEGLLRYLRVSSNENLKKIRNGVHIHKCRMSPSRRAETNSNGNRNLCPEMPTSKTFYLNCTRNEWIDR